MYSSVATNNNIGIGEDAGVNALSCSRCIYFGSWTASSSSGIENEIIIGSGYDISNKLVGKGVNSCFIGGITSGGAQINMKLYVGTNTTDI